MDDTNIGIYIWSILIWVCPDEICALEQKLRVIELHTYKELLKVHVLLYQGVIPNKNLSVFGAYLAPLMSRSSRLEVFCKKFPLKILQNLPEKHLRWSLF